MVNEWGSKNDRTKQWDICFFQYRQQKKKKGAPLIQTFSQFQKEHIFVNLFCKHYSMDTTNSSPFLTIRRKKKLGSSCSFNSLRLTTPRETESQEYIHRDLAPRIIRSICKKVIFLQLFFFRKVLASTTLIFFFPLKQG